MKDKCWIVIHRDKVTGDVYNKAFTTQELANKYLNELTQVTCEAEQCEIRTLDVYNENSDVMTPLQEDMYWDHMAAQYENNQHYYE